MTLVILVFLKVEVVFVNIHDLERIFPLLETQGLSRVKLCLRLSNLLITLEDIIILLFITYHYLPISIERYVVKSMNIFQKELHAFLSSGKERL